MNITWPEVKLCYDYFFSPADKKKTSLFVMFWNTHRAISPSIQSVNTILYRSANLQIQQILFLYDSGTIPAYCNTCIQNCKISSKNNFIRIACNFPGIHECSLFIIIFCYALVYTAIIQETLKCNKCPASTKSVSMLFLFYSVEK